MSEERFVEVADEPRHRPLLENEFVRVFDFQLRPGETTLYHRHNEDTFCVAIEPASVEPPKFCVALAILLFCFRGLLFFVFCCCLCCVLSFVNLCCCFVFL